MEMIIVDLIKELMYQQGKTIEILSKESKISYKVIENIVLNNVVPTPQDANKIFKAFGIKLEEILCLF